MQFISLDPESMTRVVGLVTDYGNTVEEQQNNVSSTNSNCNEPFSLRSSSVHEKIEELRTKVKEISDRIKTVEELNSNGVNGLNGEPGYYILDGNNDSVVNVEGTGEAIIDAKKAQESRNPEETLGNKVILRSDDSLYSAAFSEYLGPEGMSDLAERVRNNWDSIKDSPERKQDEAEYNKAYMLYQKSASALSRTLGTASRSILWSDEKKDWYAKELAKLATDPKRSAGAPRAFNMLLTGIDRSAANTVDVGGEVIESGGVFDQRFLNTVAQEVEASERESGSYPNWLNKYTSYDSSLAGSRGEWDPVTGILTAMGRNPNAVLDYLAPLSDANAKESDFKDGEVPIDASKLEWLKNRGYVDEVSKEALSAAFAGASELRKRSEDITDERAAWLTENGVVTLGGKDSKFAISESSSKTSQQNVAVMLGNSMQDVDAARRSAAPNNQTPFIASQPASWSKLHEGEVRRLLRAAGSDDTALGVLGTSAGKYAAERQQVNFEETNGKLLDEDTKHGSGLLGYIAGSAKAGREGKLDKLKSGASVFIDAVADGLKFAPSPQSKALGTGISILQSRFINGAKDVVDTPGAFEGGPLNDIKDINFTQLRANGLNLMTKAGKIPEDAYFDANNKHYEYPWLNADGTIDVKKLVQFKNGDESVKDRVDQYNGFMDDPGFDDWNKTDEESKNEYQRGYEMGAEKQ